MSSAVVCGSSAASAHEDIAASPLQLCRRSTSAVPRIKILLHCPASSWMHQTGWRRGGHLGSGNVPESSGEVNVLFRAAHW